jgi:DNA primase
LLQLHAEATEWFHENLVKGKIGKPAREYLKKRGIDGRIANDWQIGFAPDSWDAFLTWAIDRGYRRPQILQSGLIKPRDEDRSDGEAYDRFRGRIMFPIHNDVGEVIAFSGRVLEKEAEGAKYLNSPETPLFRKGRILFGLHKTKRGLIEANCAIVCEGQLDLITVFEAGITNVVAPQGTAFTGDQARILKRFVSEVVLCFDADTAGQKAAERSLDALLQNNLIVRVAEMPAGEDPDSMIRKKGKEEFQTRIAAAADFFDFWIERESAATDLASLGAKMQLARKLAETVARIHDPLMRGQVANKVSSRIGVPSSDFERLLTKPNRERVFGDDPLGGEVAPPPRRDIAMLCLLALRHPEAREFLQTQPWRETLAQTQDAEMLARILEAHLHPDDPASISAFMASLSAGDEALVSSWVRRIFTAQGGLIQQYPPNGLETAKGWWNGLRQAALRRQLQIAEGRMKLPGLTTGEVVNLQKQILDLAEQLRELPEFSSARVLDN